MRQLEPRVDLGELDLLGAAFPVEIDQERPTLLVVNDEIVSIVGALAAMELSLLQLMIGRDAVQVELDRVVAGLELHDPVDIAAGEFGTEGKAVVSGSADELIPAGAAAKPVVTAAALERVLPVAAVEPVVSGPALEKIGAAIAKERIVAAAPEETIVEGPAEQLVGEGRVAKERLSPPRPKSFVEGPPTARRGR